MEITCNTCGQPARPYEATIEYLRWRLNHLRFCTRRPMETLELPEWDEEGRR